MRFSVISAALLVFLSITFSGCSSTGSAKEELIMAYLLGSAESNDPILLKVRELEQEGILTKVIVMESYPVQMKIVGPESVINQLLSMPRKKSTDLK